MSKIASLTRQPRHIWTSTAESSVPSANRITKLAEDASGMVLYSTSMAPAAAVRFWQWKNAKLRTTILRLPAIITHALQLGTSCFLDDPQWHAAMRKCKTHHPMMIKLWVALSTLPSLLVELRGLLSSPVGGNKE
jgi:hypothetical protein